MWKNKDGVYCLEQTVDDIRLACDNCDHLSFRNIPVGAARKAAHRHAAATGHVVTVTATRLYSYGKRDK